MVSCSSLHSLLDIFIENLKSRLAKPSLRFDLNHNTAIILPVCSRTRDLYQSRRNMTSSMSPKTPPDLGMVSVTGLIDTRDKSAAIHKKTNALTLTTYPDNLATSMISNDGVPCQDVAKAQNRNAGDPTLLLRGMMAILIQIYRGQPGKLHAMVEVMDFRTRRHSHPVANPRQIPHNAGKLPRDSMTTLTMEEECAQHPKSIVRLPSTEAY